MIFSVTAVSAADFNNGTELSADADGSLVIGDSFLESSEIQDSIVSNDTTGTFSDLQELVNNASAGSVLELTMDYKGSNYARVQLHKDLTIDGMGHTIDCLGKDGCSAFYSNDGNITLKNLNIINGHNTISNKGGAIYISGLANYTVINCTFENNWAAESGGAIYNGATNELTIKNCTFKSNTVDQENGGAISSKLHLYVENSTFVSNGAYDYGGAIWAGTTAEIYNSVFKSNRANNNHGGAIYAEEYIKILNSTFKDNYALWTGGALGVFKDAYVEGCLFESNKVEGKSVQDSYGGAIRCEKLYLDNSTFKDNYAQDFAGAVFCNEIYINYNQDANQTLNTFFINNKAKNSQAGAIQTRENAYMKNTVFSGNSALVDGGAVYARGDLTATHCLFDSNKADGAKSQCYGGAIYSKDHDVYIENCTFKDNYAHDYAGAIYADNIYVNHKQSSDETFNSFFIGNKAGDNDGGALYSYYDMHVKNAVFTGNSAYEDGGAIFCCDNAFITHCLFESNKADGAKIAQCEGGAIHCKDDLTVDNCTFNKNYAYDYGGAIYADTLALKGYSYFDSNTAYDNHGGAIYVNKFREDVKYATFTNNNAGEGSNDDGGAIYINKENWITFSQCVFIKNHCRDEGGAIYLDSSKSHLTLKNNIFVSNSANEGQSVYNCGIYDSIYENWWGGNNPSSSNDQLIEWKVWPWSNIHHSDSKPLKLSLLLSPDHCNVNGSVVATVYFTSNDETLCDGVMRTDYISLVEMMKVIFSNRVDYSNFVKIQVSPQVSGTFDIFANLFGQLVSKTLYVSNGDMIENMDNVNNNQQDHAVSHDENVVNVLYLDSQVSQNNFMSKYGAGVALLPTSVAKEYFETDGSADNNQSNGSDVNDKSINSVNKQIQNESKNNFNIYWILLLILLIAGAALVWKKYKS